METHVSNRMSHLPLPGRFSLNGEKSPVVTPRGKNRASMLPSPHSVSVSKSSSKSPSTPRGKKILHASVSNSPNRLKKNSPRIPKRAGLPPHSPAFNSKGKTKQVPRSPTSSIGDRTVKVDNSLTKQRSSLSRADNNANPKHAPLVPVAVASKLARNSTGSFLTNNASGSHKSHHTLLSLSLSASSSKESNISDNEEAVKVCVRIRPVFDISWEQRAWTTGPSEENSIVKTGLDNSGSNLYRFDNVYGEEATTQQVYDVMVKDIVSSVCSQGRNGTVFTYGQTSTGKTYTMHGLISAAAKDLFQISTDDGSQSNDNSILTCVKVSCMELYNEELRDLLDTGRASASGLGIKEDRKGNVQIPGLSERVVKSFDELMSVLLEADTNRTVGSTAMNERSSRSHTIFRITYERKEAKGVSRKRSKKGQSFETTNSEDGVECTLSGGLFDDENINSAGIKKISKKMVTTVSTLCLVDLAGSESVKHTGATGERQKEGGKINQSLLTLSTVLVKLGKKEPGHINYRDSKLTRILKPSLSGNARMSAICCISPLVQFQEETKSTLDFASRTMMVTTNASRNETVEYDDMVVGEFEKEIKRLRAENANAEKGQQKLAVSLQESAEQIVCLMASIEIEKSKVANLEKQNYDFMMQVEELTLLNEELKTLEQLKPQCSDKALLKSVEELKSQNEHLEQKVGQLVDEKSQLEFRLMREIKKAEKRKDTALEKRKRFKSKLGDMKAKLRDDVTGTVPHHFHLAE